MHNHRFSKSKPIHHFCQPGQAGQVGDFGGSLAGDFEVAGSFLGFHVFGVFHGDDGDAVAVDFNNHSFAFGRVQDEV